MDQTLFTAVDRYIDDLFVPPDAALEAALEATAAAGMPPISVSPNQGKLLQLLAQLNGAQRILEIGTLGGYSTIWLARALPEDGQLITLEYEPRHAEVAQANIARAGLADRVEVRVGRAIDTLQQMQAERVTPFDVVFIDADKQSYTAYLAAVLELTRPGSLIIADNVVRDGAVINAQHENELVQSVRQFNAALATEARVDATVVQLIGSKGYDGMAIAVVRGGTR